MEFTVLGDDTIGDHLLDGIFLDIDDVDVGLIHLLVVVLLERRSFRTKRMWLLHGAENIALGRICDSRTSLVQPEGILGIG